MNLTSELKALQQKVESGVYEQPLENWGGAGVLITDTEPVRNTLSFYPDPIFVVTQHAEALSWLFEQLSVLYAKYPWPEYEDKFRFYGGLADAANEALKKETKLTAERLLGMVLACAKSMASNDPH